MVLLASVITATLGHYSKKKKQLQVPRGVIPIWPNGVNFGNFTSHANLFYERHNIQLSYLATQLGNLTSVYVTLHKLPNATKALAKLDCHRVEIQIALHADNSVLLKHKHVVRKLPIAHVLTSGSSSMLAVGQPLAQMLKLPVSEKQVKRHFQDTQWQLWRSSCRDNNSWTKSVKVAGEVTAGFAKNSSLGLTQLISSAPV